jgi:uridine kinase
MFVVGITGGSGSGKTTFAKKIIQRVDDASVALLHQDSYYLESLPEKLKVHGERNFDHPEAFDWELLNEHLTRLKNGEVVAAPIYDFKESRRTSDTELVGPCKTVLLEGIYTLWDSRIRDLCDLKVFLHVDADIRFIRRLHRDVRERGRSLDNIIRQYYDTVRPMYHEYLDPTRSYADIIVGEETDIAAEVIAARVAEMVRELPSGMPDSPPQFTGDL